MSDENVAAAARCLMRLKAGTYNIARNPIRVTTTMISTRVKPPRLFFICILNFHSPDLVTEYQPHFPKY